jgi:hypothetical protein
MKVNRKNYDPKPIKVVRQELHENQVHNLRVASRLQIRNPMSVCGDAFDGRTNCERVKYPFTYARHSSIRDDWGIFDIKGTLVERVETFDQEKVARITNEMNKQNAIALGFIVHSAE